MHLAQAGIDVTVLEANEPGWGASGRNGGQVNPGLKHEPEEIERRFGHELGQRMVARSGNAPNRVFQIVREHQIRCEANQGGTIRAAFTAKSSNFLRTATRGWRSRGAPVELLEGDALVRATGYGTLRLRCTGSAWLISQPARLCPWFSRSCGSRRGRDPLKHQSDGDLSRRKPLVGDNPARGRLSAMAGARNKLVYRRPMAEAASDDSAGI